jgi:hypothetical protein
VQQLTRPFLHAERLAIRQPRTGEPLVFEAPLPEDLRSVLDAIDPMLLPMLEAKEPVHGDDEREA